MTLSYMRLNEFVQSFCWIGQILFVNPYRQPINVNHLGEITNFEFWYQITEWNLFFEIQRISDAESVQKNRQREKFSGLFLVEKA